MSDGDETYTPDEIAEILKLPDGRWVVKEGRQYGLPLRKVGRYLRCSKQEFWAWFYALPNDEQQAA